MHWFVHFEVDKQWQAFDILTGKILTLHWFVSLLSSNFCSHCFILFRGFVLNSMLREPWSLPNMVKLLTQTLPHILWKFIHISKVVGSNPSYLYMAKYKVPMILSIEIFHFMWHVQLKSNWNYTVLPLWYFSINKCNGNSIWKHMHLKSLLHHCCCKPFFSFVFN